MSETSAKPGGSRLPLLRSIPRFKPAAGTSSNLASGRVTRQSLSAPDLSKIGVESKVGKQAPQSSLLRRAVATAASKSTQPSTLALNRKRPAPAPQPNSGPDRKKPLVQVDSNKQNVRPLKAAARAQAADNKVLASAAAPAKRGKPAPWDIKAKLEHANQKISELTQENNFLKHSAAEAVHTQEELVKIKDECESLKLELSDTKTKLDTVSKAEKDFRIQARSAQQDFDKTRKLCESLNAELSELQSKFATVKKSEETLKTRVNSLEDQLQSTISKNSELTIELNTSKQAAILKDQIRVEQIFNEQHLKRSLLNQILDLKGNIRVFCRVRPSLDSEKDRALLPFNFPNEASLELKISEKGSSHKHQLEKKTTFTYDKVFAPANTQSDVYEELSALVQSALDGHNVCVFAYGQTGSGKTYTMEGGTDEEEGMIPRSIRTMFKSIREQNELGWEFTVKCSFLEIYNENIRDLLNLNSNLTHDVKMVDTNSDDVYVSNLKVEIVPSEEVLQKLLAKAQKNRFTAATVMNEQSSRSHSITQIKLEGTNKSRNIKSQGTLNLIDLAGSEKFKSENKSDRQVETKNINRSLATLSLVVLKLAEKAEHIPFRDSKLTHLLMPSLKGNSKTLMMVNIAPFEDCLNETVSSLRFAQRVSAVKVDSKRQIKSSLSQAPVSKPGK